VTRYRKNIALAETLQRNPTLDLPLFREQNRYAPKRDKQLAKTAPRAIPVATDTRNMAHRVLQFDPEALSKKQSAVYDAFLAHRDATNTEIAAFLNWPINRVVGRTFELRQFGIVEQSQRRRCSVTRGMVWAWRAVPVVYDSIESKTRRENTPA